MTDLLGALQPHLVAILSLLATLLASGHAVLHKRDVRSAIAWVGIVWLVPVVGALLYVLIGINRIRRRGVADGIPIGLPPAPSPPALPLKGADGLAGLRRLVDRVVPWPLEEGNQVEPLVNGDAAYPAMLEAIDRAKVSVALGTYIFDNDRAGRRFADALARAVDRGVLVRVLVDDVGARYSWPSIVPALRRSGVRVARFGPTLVPWLMRHANLRSHRKILVVDGRGGFTGGMNVREGHVLGEPSRHPVADVHFRFEGPVVAHLQETFAEDWFFSTRERLDGPAWFPPLAPAGGVAARGIRDGPDFDLGRLRWTLLGALACARRSVRIVTPYFLPDSALINALGVAALWGVDMRILVPGRNNLPYVKWASTALLWQVLERGCRVFESPPPFDHAKLMVVDDAWVLLGSANWDPRSLRLNFEFCVECRDDAFAGRVATLVEERLARAREVTLAEVDERSLPVKLRDGVARLFMPYL
jgi:cardiolipin synthase A/B